jgi:hypothetical protein
LYRPGVDEAYVGGHEPGTQVRVAKNKAVVAVAVERRAEGQPVRLPVPGFASLAVLPNAGFKSLDASLKPRSNGAAMC